jgi:hypothetical protein
VSFLRFEMGSTHATSERLLNSRWLLNGHANGFAHRVLEEPVIYEFMSKELH